MDVFKTIADCVSFSRTYAKLRSVVPAAISAEQPRAWDTSPSVIEQQLAAKMTDRARQDVLWDCDGTNELS